MLLPAVVMHHGCRRNDMFKPIIRANSMILLIVAACSGALAQGMTAEQQSPSHSLSSPRQDAEADKAMRTPSGKAGIEEPSSHTPTVPPNDTLVLVDGALAVPGALRDAAATPAKYSEQKAADDRLPILAYTFKMLSDDQRQAIYQALKDEPAVKGPSAQIAQIGNALPFAVATQPVPAQLANQIPATQGFHFLVSDNYVLLISPLNRAVVGLFTATRDARSEVGDMQR